jgi:thioredoxin reductase (NADPH)
MTDIIIIGAGPAGLTAAIYALRAQKSVLILEKGAMGGQMTHSPKIENYPGFTALTGNELADKMVEQALNLGAEIELAEVTGLKTDGDVKTVVTEDGELKARAVIVATGAAHRRLGLENLRHDSLKALQNPWRVLTF